MTPRGGASRGKADMHLHTLYSDGTAGVEALLDHVERHTDLDLVAITDHERLDGALRAREIHAAGDFSFGLVVGEEITTRRGHLLALFVEERIPALRPLAGDAGAHPRRRAGWPSPRIRMAPLTPSLGRRSLLRAAPKTPIPGTAWMASSCSTPAPPDARDGSHRRRAERGDPAPAGGRQLGRPRARARRHRLDLVPRGHRPTTIAGRWPIAPPSPTASTGATGTTCRVYGRQLVAKARHLRHTLRPTGEWR